MSRKHYITSIIAVVLVVFMSGIYLGCKGKPKEEAATTPEKTEVKAAPEKMAMAFGGEEDIEFANTVWTALTGYEKWSMKTDMYPGKSPHGKFLKMYYNVLTVAGKPYHIIVKDNFDGEKNLAAVTIMLQREAGYDPDNDNWFWAKYKVDGAIDKDPMGMALAGRVAKGMDAGCIACHKGAMGNDYVFVNDGKVQ